MIIESQIDSRSFNKLMFILSYRKPLTLGVALIAILMILSAVLYFLGFNIGYETPPHFQLIFGFIILALHPLSVYRGAVSNFTSHPQLREKISYEFTDEAITETGETFDSEMEWTEVERVVELKEWILIYQDSVNIIFIPKASFGTKLYDFKDLLKRKNINAKLKE